MGNAYHHLLRSSYTKIPLGFKDVFFVEETPLSFVIVFLEAEDKTFLWIWGLIFFFLEDSDE